MFLVCGITLINSKLSSTEINNSTKIQLWTVKHVATGTKVECYIKETGANNYLTPIIIEFIYLFCKLLFRLIKLILGQKERKINLVW